MNFMNIKNCFNQHFVNIVKGASQLEQQYKFKAWQPNEGYQTIAPRKALLR